MNEFIKEYRHRKNILITTCTIIIAFAFLLGIISIIYNTNNLTTFDEDYLVINDGWLLTNENGEQKNLSLPYTISSGSYTLETTLPSGEGILLSPVFEFYSNYIDFEIFIDNISVYSYPFSTSEHFMGTGNTWHFIRLDDFANKKISINIECQLGDNITYLLEAPRIGSKATILSQIIIDDLPMLIIACSLFIFALILLILYFALHAQLKLDFSSLYIAIFALIFAVYIFLETTYIKLILGNSYAIYVATLGILALIPIPLVSLFKTDLAKKYQKFADIIVMIAIANFLIQCILHFTLISNFRIMLPVTHIVMILAIVLMAIFLFLSNEESHGRSRQRFLSALPMVIGGFLDIFLIWNNTPSYNNSMWFVLGVTAFIIIQFFELMARYFKTYRLEVENTYLRSMAYLDTLTGLGNRNAYEAYLQMLSNRGHLEGLTCIVADINKLKTINDTYGHHAGDKVIEETGKIIKQLLLHGCNAYRTGGDEFVIICDNENNDIDIANLAKIIQERIVERSKQLNIPISLSTGYGTYESDANLASFISRIDTLMYQNKRQN